MCLLAQQLAATELANCWEGKPPPGQRPIFPAAFTAQNVNWRSIYNASTMMTFVYDYTNQYERLDFVGWAESLFFNYSRHNYYSIFYINSTCVQAKLDRPMRRWGVPESSTYCGTAPCPGAPHYTCSLWRSESHEIDYVYTDPQGNNVPFKVLHKGGGWLTFDLTAFKIGPRPPVQLPPFCTAPSPKRNLQP